MSFLTFEPIYKNRVWGGRSLSEKLGRDIPEGKIGESWELVDREDDQSVVATGGYAGLPLRDVLSRHADEVMGPGFPGERPFPILVKWLDCQDRLSLQVHPPKEVAGELGGEPKTENWYIADAEPEAAILVGLESGATKEQFEAALKAEELEPLVHRIPVKAGDSMFVQSGRIHAIDAGNLILEIQQNSDTTYRVYDWGRVGLDGNPRELHVDQSMKSIDFNDFEPSVISLGHADRETTLAECEEFRIRRFSMKAGGEPLAFGSDEQPRLIGLIKGRLRDTMSGKHIVRWQNVLLPYNQKFNFVPEEDTVVLVTDNFVGAATGA